MPFQITLKSQQLSDLFGLLYREEDRLAEHINSEDVEEYALVGLEESLREIQNIRRAIGKYTEIEEPKRARRARQVNKQVKKRVYSLRKGILPTGFKKKRKKSGGAK